MYSQHDCHNCTGQCCTPVMCSFSQMSLASYYIHPLLCRSLCIFFPFAIPFFHFPIPKFFILPIPVIPSHCCTLQWIEANCWVVSKLILSFGLCRTMGFMQLWTLWVLSSTGVPNHGDSSPGGISGLQVELGPHIGRPNCWNIDQRWPNKLELRSVCTYVHSQSFSDFNLIWCLGWVNLDQIYAAVWLWPDPRSRWR